MTTIKDLLNDFFIESTRMANESVIETPADSNDFEEAKEQLIEEYIQIIKERIVG